jgi:hypothetical protein
MELVCANPVIVDHFDVDPEKANSLKTKINAKQAANPDKDVRHRGDSLWVYTFSNENGWKMLDQTVYGIHSASNWKHTVTEEGYTSRLPEVAATNKDTKHAHYLHDGDAVGLAFDSAGGISKSATNVINFFYSKGKAGAPRGWHSESLRTAMKKHFLDTISCVIMRHRVLDYARLGLPNTKMRGIQTPHARGGATDINIVNNGGERAHQVAAAECSGEHPAVGHVL